MKRLPLTFSLLLFVPFWVFGQQRFIQFVHVSDCHYGIARYNFRGQQDVPANEVNRSMIARIEGLPEMELPADGGVRGGEKIGWVDCVVNTGDVSNRSEDGVQRSARSWRQFTHDWNDIVLRDSTGSPARMFLLPGNHDISNAIGHPDIPRRKIDATAAAGIYNAMLHPEKPLTNRTYDRQEHLCNYWFDNSGVRFLFVDMWPDSTSRAWLETRLEDMPDGGVGLLFVHDQPDIEAKHLSGPVEDGFENLVGDRSGVPRDRVPTAEHDALDDFMAVHPSIRAWFHGNDNYNEFYTWGSAAELPVFRVDSPVKGIYSHKDESILSFSFVVIDTVSGEMTVREYFWNSSPVDASAADTAVWGATKTISLRREQGSF